MVRAIASGNPRPGSSREVHCECHFVSETRIQCETEMITSSGPPNHPILPEWVDLELQAVLSNPAGLVAQLQIVVVLLVESRLNTYSEHMV